MRAWPLLPKVPAAWNAVAKGPLKTTSCSTPEDLDSFMTMSAAAAV